MRKKIIVLCVVLLCVVAIVIYTAFPHNAYACLQSHVILVPRYITTCEKVGKTGEECTTRFVGFFPETLCDVYSSPTPEPGWFFHR